MKLPFPGRYCIDTSALIDLRRYPGYPPDVFPSLWRDLERLIQNRSLVAPREVLEELENYEDKDDPVLKWAKNNRRMFVDLTDGQVQIAKDILKKFPNLIKPNKTTADADPFIIALARYENCSVVTSEKGKSGSGIPGVCNHYGIECLLLIEFFGEQKWKY